MNKINHICCDKFQISYYSCCQNNCIREFYFVFLSDRNNFLNDFRVQMDDWKVFTQLGDCLFFQIVFKSIAQNFHIGDN